MLCYPSPTPPYHKQMQNIYFPKPTKSNHLYPLNSLLIVQGLTHQTPFLLRFLDACFHLGDPQLAVSAFKAIPKPPTVSALNLVLKGLSNHGLHEKVLSLYQSCCLFRFWGNAATFAFVIKASSRIGEFGLGREVHCVVFRNGYGGNAVIGSALVGFYAQMGRADIARQVFDEIPQRDLVCYNALVAGFSICGYDWEVFRVLKGVFAVGLRPNVSTLASVIPVCTRSSCLDIGRSLHGYAIKSGFFGNHFLVPALISLYAGCSGGDFEVSGSRKLFDSVVEKGIAVWNAMISAYTQKRMSVEAFEVFFGMLSVNTGPDPLTFSSIIPSCEHLGLGQSLHALVIRHGLGDQVPVLIALVSMYAKFGDIDTAEVLFSWIPSQKLLSWNVMIAGYVQNGLWDASLNAFTKMQFSGVRPDVVSVVSVLSACSCLDATLLGKSAHAFCTRLGLDLNISLSNALLAFYCDANNLIASFRLFDRMPNRDSVTWNTMISGCVHSGLDESALDLLVLMQKERVLDIVTLVSVLPVFDDRESSCQGKTLHGYAIKKGFDSDVSLVNALISMYPKCGDLEAGEMLFEGMPRKCVVSWNALMTGYRNRNLQNEAIICFYQMIEDNMRPNSLTLMNLLALCSSQLQGRSIHAFAIRTGILGDISLLTSVISMYARFGSEKLCLTLFEMGEKGHISVWNSMISGLAQTKSAEKAVVLFQDMLQMDLCPENITSLSLISACIQLNNHILSQSVMAYVVRMGFASDTVIGNALVNLYARSGDISLAKSIFETLTRKDAATWSTMIHGYALHGNAEAAFELFSDMQLLGVRPDEHTFSSMLSICSRAGLVEQGSWVFNSMMKQGVLPGLEHYAWIMDLLGRAGCLNEAYEIVKNFPWRPSVSVLEPLLAACRLHGNVEIGEKVSQMIFDIDPDNSGPYVMLSSIYAETGRWEEASRVRSIIEDRHLRKMPGFTLLLGDQCHDAIL